MIKIYTSPACLGCRKAIEFFKENHLEYQEKDFTKYSLTKPELLDILSLSENGFDDILSIRSKAYKQNQKRLDDLLTDEIIKLIIAYPEILSRPIMIQYVKDKPYRLMIGYNNHDIEIFLRKDTKRVSVKQIHCSLREQCDAECAKD